MWSDVDKTEEKELSDTITCQSELFGLPIRFTQESKDLFERGHPMHDDQRPCDLFALDAVPDFDQLSLNTDLKRAYVRVINKEKNLNELYYIDRDHKRTTLVKAAYRRDWFQWKHNENDVKDLAKFDALCAVKSLPFHQLLNSLTLNNLYDNFFRPHNPFRLKGQGYPYIAWKGEDEDNKPVLYVSLVPAVNKDDGMPGTDKDDKPFEYMAASRNDRLGGNTGVVHQLAKVALIQRMKDAGDTIPAHERFPADIKPEHMCAGGFFKGDSEYLLAESRNNSGNFNIPSFQYDNEFRLCNLFISTQEELHDVVPTEERTQYEFFIRRRLPRQIFYALTNAALRDLPGTVTYRKVKHASNWSELFQDQSWWEENRNNKTLKNKMLMRSVFLLACHVSDRERKENPISNDIKDFEAALSYIKQNDGGSQLLNQIFEYAPAYGKTTALMQAVRSKNMAMVTMLLDAGADINITTESGYSAINYALTTDNNAVDIKIATLLLQRGAILFREPQGDLPPDYKKLLSIYSQKGAMDEKLSERDERFKQLYQESLTQNIDKKFDAIKELDDLARNLLFIISEYKPHGSMADKRRNQIIDIKRIINESYKHVFNDQKTIDKLITNINEIITNIKMEQKKESTIAMLTRGLFSIPSTLSKQLSNVITEFEKTRKPQISSSKPSLPKLNNQ